jgi:hypothetical protein
VLEKPPFRFYKSQNDSRFARGCEESRRGFGRDHGVAAWRQVARGSAVALPDTGSLNDAADTSDMREKLSRGMAGREFPMPEEITRRRDLTALLEILREIVPEYQPLTRAHTADENTLDSRCGSRR